MVDLSWTGFVVWGINALLFFMLQKTNNIGPKMSGAISGWISALIGIFILYSRKVSFMSILSVSSSLYIGISVAVVLVFLYFYASNVRNRSGFFGNVGYFLTRTGWVIGFIMGLLCAVIK